MAIPNDRPIVSPDAETAPWHRWLRQRSVAGLVGGVLLPLAGGPVGDALDAKARELLARRRQTAANISALPNLLSSVDEVLLEVAQVRQALAAAQRSGRKLFITGLILGVPVGLLTSLIAYFLGWS